MKMLRLSSVLVFIVGEACTYEEGLPETTVEFEQLVTHMHYHEEGVSGCHLALKRSNFALFLSGLHHLGKVVVTSTKKPFGDNYEFIQVNNTPTDLCPRALVLENFPASHYLFLNDGARGPLGSLAPFQRAFAEPSTRVAGVVASCEGSLHVQSWAMMIDARVKGIFAERYSAACRKGVPKPAIIKFAEIGAVTEAMQVGTLASLWPPLHRLRKKCYPDIHRCQNLYVPSRYPGEFPEPEMLEDVAFTKFGGAVWDFIPLSFKKRVLAHNTNETILFEDDTCFSSR